jgi:UDP-glucose 4-epimerase
MRLLVTGGAGYIGGFVARQLKAHGHDVTVVDDLSSGHPKAAGDATLVIADVGDRVAIGELLRAGRVEAVLHFAGLKSVAESWTEPDRYFDVNVNKTVSLLRAMADTGVSMLVYSSSCAVYGESARQPIDETAAVAPLNLYARSKWLAEESIADAARNGALSYVALRYFNAAGADPEGNAGEILAGASNLIPMVMKVALGILPHVEIYGTDYPTPDGTAVRDYVHVLDLASAHERSLEYLCGGGASVTVNVGTGRGTSVRQVVAATERISGRPLTVIESDRRAGDPAMAWTSADLAHHVLGWRSRRGIEEILSSAWRWHSRHPDGYR